MCSEIVQEEEAAVFKTALNPFWKGTCRASHAQYDDNSHWAALLWLRGHIQNEYSTGLFPCHPGAVTAFCTTRLPQLRVETWEWITKRQIQSHRLRDIPATVSVTHLHFSTCTPQVRAGSLGKLTGVLQHMCGHAACVANDNMSEQRPTSLFLSMIAWTLHVTNCFHCHSWVVWVEL